MTWQPNADWESLAKVFLSWKDVAPEWEQRMTKALVAVVLPNLMAHRFGEPNVEVLPPSEPSGLVVVCGETRTVTLVAFDDEAVPLPLKYENWASRRLNLRFRLDEEPRSYVLPKVEAPDNPTEVCWLECFGYLESQEFRQFLTKWSRRRFWPAPAEIRNNPINSAP